jgi:hypothetical protein
VEIDNVPHQIEKIALDLVKKITQEFRAAAGKAEMDIGYEHRTQLQRLSVFLIRALLLWPRGSLV